MSNLSSTNDEEIALLALGNIVRNDELGLDIPVSSSSEAESESESELPSKRIFSWDEDRDKFFMATLYLRQPSRQERLANASGDPELIAHIRSLKRDPTRLLDHDNANETGRKFLVQKTCEELNGHMAPDQVLDVDFCSQKIATFQQLAVDTVDACCELWKMKFKIVHEKQLMQLREENEKADDASL